MEKIVQQKLNGKCSSEIRDLHIEGSKFGCIEGLNEDFKTLEELEILNCGLKSLKGLPILPSLKTLLLGDNFLKGEEEIKIVVESCTNLRTLSLVGNRFDSVDDFKLLASLKSLNSLDVFNCPLTEKQDYRDKLWTLLPQLAVLDGYDKDGKEVNDDEEDDEDDEEDPEDDEDDEDDDEDIGLDYLQKEITDSEEDEEEDDYNPDGVDDPPSDDHEFEDDSDNDEGPSTKRPKLDPPVDDDDDDDDDDD